MNKVVSTGLSGVSRKVKNTAGGMSYSLPAKERLVTGILTSFFNEPKETKDTPTDLVTAARELSSSNPEFVAKAAVFARNEFHMRTISHVLAAEVSHGAKGNQIIRRMTRRIIERPDDITNILAYHFTTFGNRNPKKDVDGKPIKSENPVPRSLRRGIADIFGKFSEYHLAKYKSDKGLVKLRDALLICRPKPKDLDQAALWKRLIEGKLVVPVTRETVLSEKGQSKETWEGLIDSGLGYMAILRNLGNFIKNKVSDAHLAKVITRLTNEKSVAESKQLPFRFFSAYNFIDRLRLEVSDKKQTENIELLKEALDKALSLSVKNMPKLSGITFMTADESGSMNCLLSDKGTVRVIDVGNLLMATADGFCEKSIVTVFGDKTAKVDLDKDSSIFNKMSKITQVGNTVGMSTKMVTAIDYLITNNLKVDRIIVFSDMQAYDHSYMSRENSEVQDRLATYKKQINPDVWVHSIDLTGKGTIKAKGPKVNLIAGWSEKIFDFINMSENAGTSLIDTIENYKV